MACIPYPTVYQGQHQRIVNAIIASGQPNSLAGLSFLLNPCQ
jgi:hypothetical protein